MGRVEEFRPNPPMVPPLEAWKWDGTEEDAGRIISWFVKFQVDEKIVYIHRGDGPTDVSFLEVRSGDITMSARAGDYIVRSAGSRTGKKRFYTARGDTFESTHYKVGASVANVH